MARTSRKTKTSTQTASPSVPEVKIWRAAGYARLSLEDSGKPGSDTLDSQKQMLTEYIESQGDLSLTGLFCDNGHTGTNFERPEFDRLLEAVRQGEVDCIVVKDLSRFGRNYKETGNYLERIFPFLGVRFISIHDNFDTETAERNEYGFIVPLKNLINETYSRDISAKVSSAIEAKERSGEFIGIYAPYGYSKSEADRHKLVINPETAPVIREIFELRLSGMGYTWITRRLNERGVPSPGAYLYQKGLSHRGTYRTALWAAWNIKEILKNEVYLGHLVQGKCTNASYKQKRAERYAPAHEWRIVRNTHEAIIDEETFAAVQKINAERKNTYEATLGKGDAWKTPNRFRKLIYCADCGQVLNRRHIYTRRGGERIYYYSYQCLTWNRKASACTPKNLMERELLTITADTIQRHMDAAAELEARVTALWEKKAADRHRLIRQQLMAAERELSRCQGLYDGLYQQLVEGVITRQEYMSLKERFQLRCEEAEARLESLRVQEREAERYGPDNPMFRAYHALRDMEPLSEELIHALISRIEVSDNNLLDIKLTYQDEFKALLDFVEEVSKG